MQAFFGSRVVFTSRELSSPVFTLAMTSRIADGTVDQRQRLTFDTLSETIYSSSGSVLPASFALSSASCALHRSS